MFTTLLLSIFLAQASPDYPKSQTVLNGSIETIDKVPAELYGQWAIHSTLLEARNRDDYKEVTSDIWVFTRWGDALTLTNPVTEATATINVDEVVNHNARFSRQSNNPNKHERETVQIDIDDDRFAGIDTFVIEKYQKGKLISQDVVKYKLRGTKISGGKDIFN